MFVDFQDYFERYQLTVPEQLENSQIFLPSILSRNTRLLHSRPTNIIERLEWINSQKINQHSSIPQNELTMSRFTLKERLQSPEVVKYLSN